jgi:hypothetical protein
MRRVERNAKRDTMANAIATHPDLMIRMANAIASVGRDTRGGDWWAPYDSEDEWYQAEVEGPTETWTGRFGARG